MRPNVRVCVSLEWLGKTLCAIHNRIGIDKQYLLAVNEELILQLETDLSSGSTLCSLNNCLMLALETVNCPYMIISERESEPGCGVSKTETPKLQGSPQ